MREKRNLKIRRLIGKVSDIVGSTRELLVPNVAREIGHCVYVPSASHIEVYDVSGGIDRDVFLIS